MIEIKYSLDKSDLVCCICLEDMTVPLIQCSDGNHFVCHHCKTLLESECCPCCRTNVLFRNRLLEKHLDSQLIECGNSGCSLKMFPWTVESHHKLCLYGESECFLCGKVVSLDSTSSHIKDDCNAKWIEKDAVNTT